MKSGRNNGGDSEQPRLSHRWTDLRVEGNKKMSGKRYAVGHIKILLDLVWNNKGTVSIGYRRGTLVLS